MDQSKASYVVGASNFSILTLSQIVENPPHSALGEVTDLVPQAVDQAAVQLREGTVNVALHAALELVCLTAGQRGT